MNLNVHSLVEQVCLAVSILGPGLLLARATNSGLAFFVVMALQYTLGALGGLVLYLYRSPKPPAGGSHSNSDSSGGQSLPLPKAA